MNKEELSKVLSDNIKKFRKGIFTQETLAEKTGLSVQQINGIEGCRKFVSTESLLKIANALNVEVYQLFLPNSEQECTFKEITDAKILRNQIQGQIINEIRKTLNKKLDKLELAQN